MANARISKPYVRPIVRGKEVESVEFGAKVNNILGDGISFIEKLSFNEGTYSGGFFYQKSSISAYFDQ